MWKLIGLGVIALALMGALSSLYFKGRADGYAKCEAHIQASIKAAAAVDAQAATEALARAEAGRRAAELRAADERTQADAYREELAQRGIAGSCALDDHDLPRLRSRFQ